MVDEFGQSLTALSNALLLHVVPLFNVPTGKRPALIGCGLLVDVCGEPLLVSARHVIDRYVEPGGLHYYVERSKLHRLVGTVVRTAPTLEQGEHEPFDVAVVRLAPESILPSGDAWKVPLDFSALRPGDSPRTRKQYVVVGFPRSRSKANPHNRQLKSEPSSFRIVASEQSAYTALGLRDDTHIVLNLDVDHMNFPDGSVRQIADPHGMSGAPLWMLFDEDGENDPKMTPVVGIVIEYHKSLKALVATDIGVALALIEKSAA